MTMLRTDRERAQAFFRTDPLKYLVHLKYMHLYGDSITCTLIERAGKVAILLRYPSERVVWDRTAYPTAEQVLLPAAEDAGMAEVLLDHMQNSGLLGCEQVIKFCDADTEAVMCKALDLQFARRLTSYTSAANARFNADPAVQIETHPRPAHIAALVENGYSADEIGLYFGKGATLFSLYEGDQLCSSCMIYQNFDRVWEVAGVHTHVSARRKGYGRRVVQTALWQVLRERRIPRYHVEAVNTASIQLAEGLGLQPCLHFTHYLYKPVGKG